MAKKNPFKLDVVSVRLVKDAPLMTGYPVNSPEEAMRAVGQEMCQMDREVVCVINLKADGTPINCTFASIGALNTSIAHPRELIKATFLSNAAQMILIHNHPSGNLKPSKEDTVLTDQLLKLCALIDIQLLDHLIVAAGKCEFFSFREKGLLITPKLNLQTDYRDLEFDQPMVAEEGRKR